MVLNTYFFHLGREHDLALAELAAILPANVMPDRVVGSYLFVTSPDELPLSTLQDRLGGTISCGRILTHLPLTTSEETLIEALTGILRHEAGRNFALSGNGKPLYDYARIGVQLKRILKNEDISRRFVAAKQGEISSVVLHDQLTPPKGTHLLILHANNDLWIGQTDAVQNWKHWSDRDFGRPSRDARRGMLPPKLARIMVNLSNAPMTGTILDPFSGVGTVLMEAALIGYRNLIGSDRDSQALDATRLNWTWLRQHEGIAVYPQLLTASVEDLARHLSSKVSTVVSEADLGPANLQKRTPTARIAAMEELRKHYELWLEKIESLVERGGVVVLAYPELRLTSYNLDLETTAKRRGWELILPPADWQTFITQPLRYARPDQLIGRRFLIARPKK